MTDPKTKSHLRIKDADADLDRLDRHAATILAVVLMLSLMSYSILLQVLP